MKILTQLFFMLLLILIFTLMFLNPVEKGHKLSSNISATQSLAYNLSEDIHAKKFLIAAKFTY